MAVVLIPLGLLRGVTKQEENKYIRLDCGHRWSFEGACGRYWRSCYPWKYSFEYTKGVQVGYKENQMSQIWKDEKLGVRVDVEALMVCRCEF